MKALSDPVKAHIGQAPLGSPAVWRFLDSGAADGVTNMAVDAALLAEPAERDLAQALAAALADTDPLLAQRDYLGVLRRLAALRAPVDAFFDGVMVMDEDLAVRGNRLALLRGLADRFAAVAAVEQLSVG